MADHQIKPEAGKYLFNNQVSFCVGTGRMGLALHEEYMKQLREVQAKCAFTHIRGHGLFSDDMAIYQERVDPDGVRRVQYCFTYLDRVMDAYMDCGLRPFLELGFMPAALAAGEQTLFYWKAHTTPPKDMKDWTALVSATLKHLSDRYGKSEVETWPVEVWNEPNLPGFWENADKAKYLELYDATVRAVKQVLPGMRVGGPAICGGEGSQQWIADFLAFCRDGNVPVDFVTRHVYLGQTPERRGRYLYHTMSDPKVILDELAESRRIIDSFPAFKGMPMYVTEFNTSYNPFCPIHDTVENAALIAELLSGLGDTCSGYSYWTFGDVFEEGGVPTRPFHGGFGMMAAGCIPKPTLYAFAYYASLKGECVCRGKNCVMTKNGSAYEAVLWNLEKRDGEESAFALDLPLEGDAFVSVEKVEDGGADPLKVWHEMGEPASLSRDQEALLKAAAQPVVESRVLHAGDKLNLTLKHNAVARVRVTRRTAESDAGYDYTYYRKESCK